MYNKIKIALVNYLNTKPFLYGLSHHPILEQVELIECSPAACAAKYTNKEVDICLVPVGAVTGQSFHIISDFGISSLGPVSSVCLVSNVPMDQIQKVYLDYQSRTSVQLIKILFNQYWKQEVEFVDTLPGFEDQVDEFAGALIIGDRALHLKQNFKFVVDLGSAWHSFSGGLPFVYAVWLSTKDLETSFLASFNEAIQLGINSLDQVIEQNKHLTSVDLHEYYTRHIKFPLNSESLAGMNLFLELAEQENNATRDVHPLVIL